MYKVAVIMSTYNGEKYLKEQLNSIFSQRGVDITLYVRDDGSSDSTCVILENMSKMYENLQVSYGTNIGVGNSFMTKLYEIEETFDYYSFADQDDVWLPDKLIAGIRMLEKKEGPALYASNQIVTDKELREQGMRFNKVPGIRYGEIIRGNMISGCTFIFNRALFTFLVAKENRPNQNLLSIRIHDVWVAVVAALFGEIMFDSNSFILYRQHESNVVGASKKSFLNEVKVKVSRLFLPKLCTGGVEMAKFLAEMYDCRLGEMKTPISTYAQYKEFFSRKVSLLGMYDIFGHDNESRLMFSLKILLNRF